MFFKKGQGNRAQGQPSGLVAGPHEHFNVAPQYEPTFLANDMVIEGNVNSSGELHIDGAITGTVRAEICVVDINGRIAGQIEASTVHVYGQVEGPIVASHVQIYAGAVVRSDIYHRTIGIENGADVLGNFMRQDSSRPELQTAPPPAASKPMAQKQAHNGSNGATSDFFAQVLGETAGKPANKSAFSPIVTVNPKSASGR